MSKLTELSLKEMQTGLRDGQFSSRELVDAALKRIEERDRSCESRVTLEYLQRLYDNYEEFLSDISKLIPVLRVKWEEYVDVEPLADAITKEYMRGSFLREVTTLV